MSQRSPSEPAGSPAEHERSLPDGEPGARIGRYRLLQPLGEGGFATVFEAEQLEPVARRVALKLLKPGMDSGQVLARFEAERQALALMDHPSIARILDGGTTAGGRPYFVMELVRGVTLTEHCRRNRLGLRARIELLLDVCAAVQHAHQRGVLHRDLKPSNVLVTEHEGRAVPKVIDFGIAKALHARLTQRTLLTEVRQFMGTPAYMSPEQAENDGLDVDTRSDVYALGVLAYELCTGTTPLDGERLSRASYEELLRLIREQEAQRPSLRVLTDEGAARAARGELDAGELVAQLRGDLDWIVLKALEKQRARRYESVSALAADLRAFLEDRPVEARPPSLAYRVTKFVRRHRFAVGTAALLVAVLVAGLAGTTYGLWRALDEAEQAHRAREHSEEVTSFLEGMLASIDPDGLGPEAKVSAMLELATLRLAALGDRQPAVEARLRIALGSTYRALGRLAEAEAQFQRTLELCRTSLGAEAPEAFRARLELTGVRIAAGRETEAEEALDALVPELERARGEEDPLTLGALSNLAVVRARRGSDEETLALQRRVLALQERVLGPLHEHTLGSLVNLSLVLQGLGRTNEAEAPARAAVAGFERSPVAGRMAHLRAQSNLAMVEARLGRTQEGERRLAAVVEEREALLGRDHPDALEARTFLGVMRQERGAHAEAFEVLAPASARLRDTLGAGHTLSVLSASTAVEALGALGWPEAGFEWAGAALEGFAALAPEAPLPAGRWNDLATTVLRMPEDVGDAALALRFAERACELARARGGAELARCLGTLAMAQERSGLVGAAIASAREALALLPEGAGARTELLLRLHAYERSVDASK